MDFTRMSLPATTSTSHEDPLRSRQNARICNPDPPFSFPVAGPRAYQRTVKPPDSPAPVPVREELLRSEIGCECTGKNGRPNQRSTPNWSSSKVHFLFRVSKIRPCRDIIAEKLVGDLVSATSLAPLNVRCVNSLVLVCFQADARAPSLWGRCEQRDW